MPGRRKQELSELHENEKFRGRDRKTAEESERHCEEVYTDQDEAREVQE